MLLVELLSAVSIRKYSHRQGLKRGSLLVKRTE